MKLKTVLFATFTALSITACTSQPTIPQLTAGVLQEVQNLDVYPDTTDNKAKLTKFSDKCVIEFSGNMKGGKAVEQWSFKGNSLISGGSAVFAKDGTSKATSFDLNDATVQQNFLLLRKNFAKEAIAQCD
ncbi:hypothetical protein [Acinetobacter sp. WCHAc010052]|uniref:hypothetical protein n=1 Tax=Acinetobacter sp. WCHAc010052 TaxID=2004647 RepID=UPI000B3CC1DA|nr:hypothetical protein [Acinetobacter sp. WCHAc010052]AXY61266.1 hypothetical protein CDG61_15370 [Acinetobacter sp. WCHAc010052]